MAICNWCEQDMLTATTCKEEPELPAPVLWDEAEPCHDCRVTFGGKHHPGCDAERCPECGGQMISCGCYDDDADPARIDWSSPDPLGPWTLN